MSGQPEFYTYTRDDFVAEFVHPDERAAVEEARQRRTLQAWAEYLTEMRKKVGLAKAEVAEGRGISQRRVSAIESGSVAELAASPASITPAMPVRRLPHGLADRHRVWPPVSPWGVDGRFFPPDDNGGVP